MSVKLLSLLTSGWVVFAVSAHSAGRNELYVGGYLRRHLYISSVSALFFRGVGPVCIRLRRGPSVTNTVLNVRFVSCRAFHQNCLTPAVKPEAFPSEEEDWFCWQCECLTDCLEMIEEEFQVRPKCTFFPDFAGFCCGCSAVRYDRSKALKTSLFRVSVTNVLVNGSPIDSRVQDGTAKGAADVPLCGLGLFCSSLQARYFSSTSRALQVLDL